MNAAARTGVCSTSGRCHSTSAPQPHRSAHVHEHRAHRARPVRVTNEGKEMADEEQEKFDKEYMNLGPQFQIPNPELGPLEKRVQTTFVEGLLSGDIKPEDSDYWFTEPEGGWNQQDRILKKGIQAPLTYASARHEGLGRKSLREFKEGMVLTGKVNAMYFNHGIKVDMGGLFDGLVPAYVQEEAWNSLAGKLEMGMKVKARVHKIFTGPRCRFPIQLELLEPAELVDNMKPPDEYYPSFDLRDLSTIEELEWATGMDVTGGKEVEVNTFDRDRLKDRMSEVASVETIEGWEEHFEKGIPPPPAGQFCDDSLLDQYVSRQGSYGDVVISQRAGSLWE
ncbi:hypothetical protein CVIRNUC_001462 [Coccomyxa viridis]|uniref:S1 motif domain-containing protein n=1 Tax=Coccomyxa viridis TaxID=1274662 RepID=A0AAV1HU39_9CHLO|nr:hypothetical protein CVIRNUC_001462 [Coccomyxa viridis]